MSDVYAYAEHSGSDIESEITSLLEAVYVQYKYDFRSYSRASMRRRIGQSLSSLNYQTIPTLQENILKNAVIFSKLLQFLTVPVTEMFRDPTYFRSFREKVIPVLRTYPSLKIWIAGCSTGEEVYSFAIILKEEGLLEKTIIYATDINEHSLNLATAGIFKLEDIQGFTSNYHASGGKEEFSNYYTVGYNSVIFSNSLKQNVVFSDHSLATDNVFSEVQFVSCRNVLIYFQKSLQARSIGLFNDSLCRKGFMGLGPKETIEYSNNSENFRFIDKANRIYQKVDLL